MHRKPTEEEREALRDLFPERPEAACEDCGGYHWRACPRVKRKVFVGEGMSVGNLIEVEYWEKWDSSEVIFPEEVWDEEDDD